MPTSIELAARLSAVVAAQQEMLSVINDPEKVMQLVVNRTPEVTSGDGAVIEMVEDDELVYRAASGSAIAHLGMRLATNKSLSGTAVRERHPIRCDDTERDARVDADACRAIGIRSMIIAPLLQGNTAIGALKTFAVRPNAFDDLDAYTLQLLAGMTSSALMQAHEFRERQASEQRYRMLFERNVAGVFRSTLDGRFLDCNDALAEYLGYSSREELLGRPTWDLYHQRSDREEFIAMLQRDRAITNVHMNLKKKDGSAITGVVNVSIIPAEEGETHLLGTLVAQ
jgi:PAS domain S-box-containing protein